FSCFCSCGFICVFAVLINKVSLQGTVEAVIGGSVLLPCSSTEHDHEPNVHWRDNKDKIVYSIIKGKGSVKEQDPRYKNRAETFPQENKRGNFSIKLNNLQYADGGKYICYITHSSELQTVQLIINESTAEKENGLIDQGNQREETGSDVVTSSHSLWVYIVLPVVLIVLIFV
ncbi:hypothetical protein PO909_027109, partial [Leuciscus waleckii]